jgi:hypothetical protein
MFLRKIQYVLGFGVLLIMVFAFTGGVDAADSEAGEDLLKWRQPKTLYVKYRVSGYEVEEGMLPEIINETYYTGNEYETITQEEYYAGNKLIITQTNYGSKDCFALRHWDHDHEEYYWTAGEGWGDRAGRYDGDQLIGGRELSRWWDEDISPGGAVFRPLNIFAYVLFRKIGNRRKIHIAEYRTGKHETILGINCDVFTVDGATFWVDPATHYTLKFQDASGYTVEALKYDTNYSGGIPYKPE